MNYYPHHIGDYAKDTAHLSMLEDAAYRRMLDVYYGTERPLPADSVKVCRLVRAKSLAERKAVDAVLAEFFVLEADGWRNNRADIEIAQAQSKAEKARASAALRWQSQGNANAMRTHTEGNAPNNQEPRTKEKKSNGAPRLRSLPEGFEISTRVREWALEKGFANSLQAHFDLFLSYVKKKQPKYADWDEALMGCIRDDWGDVRKKSGTVAPIADARPSRTCSDCKKQVFVWTGDRCEPCWRKYMGMAA